MSSINDPDVQELLSGPNYAVISTHNTDGSTHSTVVWVGAERDALSVNSAVGRIWPTNLERDPRATVLVQEAGNPYKYVEIRGTADGSTEEADAHIDSLAKKYLGVDEYPYRQPGEQRIKFVIEPEFVRLMKQ
jgi:PPOX class probable F420-dependent enzyme